MGNRYDKLRLRQIYTILISPFDDQDEERLTAEQKLHFAFRPDDFPIYRRKVLKPMPVDGLWWMNESQWLRFMWQGHNATILKSGQDPDRVLATRSFGTKSWIYVREGQDQIDLEGLSQVTMWDPVRKKRKGVTREWLTVSITKEKYNSLDGYMGPVEDSCNHEEVWCDYPDA